MNKRILASVLLLSIIMPLSKVFAIDLGISPPVVDLKLNRGEVYRGELFIYGSEQETTNVFSYLNDWSLNSTGDYQFIPAGTLKRSASPWISFSPRTLSIPAKRGQTVQYTIKVPANASGSYWGVIMFSSKPNTHKGNERVQVAMAARIAFVVRIDIIGSPLGVGSIERYTLNWDRAKQKLDVNLRVKNSGDSFIHFKGQLEIKNSQGNKVGVIPFSEGIVLPDLSREFKLVDSDLKLAPGYYVGLAIADFGGRSVKAAQTSFEIKN